MAKVKSAAFSLEDFKVNKFSFEYDTSFDYKNVSIEFDPRVQIPVKLYHSFRTKLSRLFRVKLSH